MDPGTDMITMRGRPTIETLAVIVGHLIVTSPEIKVTRVDIVAVEAARIGVEVVDDRRGSLRG